MIVNQASKTIVVAVMVLLMTVVTTSTAPAQMSAVHSGTHTLKSVGDPPGGSLPPRRSGNELPAGYPSRALVSDVAPHRQG